MALPALMAFSALKQYKSAMERLIVPTGVMRQKEPARRTALQETSGAQVDNVSMILKNVMDILIVKMEAG